MKKMFPIHVPSILYDQLVGDDFGLSIMKMGTPRLALETILDTKYIPPICLKVYLFIYLFILIL